MVRDGSLKSVPKTVSKVSLSVGRNRGSQVRLVSLQKSNNMGRSPSNRELAQFSLCSNNREYQLKEIVKQYETLKTISNTQPRNGKVRAASLNHDLGNIQSNKNSNKALEKSFGERTTEVYRTLDVRSDKQVDETIVGGATTTNSSNMNPIALANQEHLVPMQVISPGTLAQMQSNTFSQKSAS